MTHYLIYLLCGAFAGLMSGMVGIGGGIVVVPSLLWIFSYEGEIPRALLMHMAAGTSLCIMLFTASSTIWAHAVRGAIRVDIFRKLAPGVAIGVIGGAFVAGMIPTTILEKLFGIFLLFIAWHMLRPRLEVSEPHPPSPWTNRLVSFVIGFKSGVLGIGGGALIVPYLSWCGFAMRNIPPVSSLCTLMVAVIGTASFMLAGWHDPALPPMAAGYVYLPAVLAVAIPSMVFAPLGAHLAWKVPEKPLRRCFVVLLLITAIKMLWV